MKNNDTRALPLRRLDPTAERQEGPVARRGQRSQRTGLRAVGTLALLASVTACANAEPVTSAAADEVHGDSSRARAQAGSSDLAETLPPGWRLSADSKILSWDAPSPIPQRDAFLQVHIDDRVALVPAVAADRKSLHVVLPSYIEDLSRVRVTAGGVPLERPVPVEVVSRRAAETGAPLPVQPLPTLDPADDPGKPGPYETTEGEYEETALKLPGLKVPVEVRALVVAPVGAPGPRPVAVFLHGNHSPCYAPEGSPQGDGRERSWWPCSASMLPVPSYRGYVDAQRLLASQGVITISISQNGINGQTDQGWDIDAASRAALLREHLSRWARGTAGFSSAGAAVVSGQTPDPTKLLLVGHSRGGAGVNRFALDSAIDPSSPWRVQAQLLIGPTNMRRNPAPGVPSVVLLPACDGDVVNLEGQRYADDARDITADTALRSVVYIEGASHNFFNALWTPGVGPDATDDAENLGADDSACGTNAPTRLSPETQRKVGAVYAAAAAQVFLYGRTEVAPLLDGTPVRAESAGDVTALAHALGGYRSPLLIPTAKTSLAGKAGIKAELCLTHRTVGAPGSCVAGDPESPPRTPSFGPSLLINDPKLPSQSAVHLSWSTRGGTAQLQLGGAAIDPLATALTARVIVPPASAGTSFRAHLVDKAGKRVSLGDVLLGGLPARASVASGVYWAQEVRLPLNRGELESAGVDLTQLATLELEADSATGELWLLDAFSYRPGVPKAEARSVARIDLEKTTVTETNGPQKILIPASIAGRLNEPALVYYQITDNKTGQPTSDVISLAAGQTAFDLEYEISGDELETGTSFVSVQIASTRGAVVGAASTYVTVNDDELTPDVTVAPVAASAAEGSPLQWTFSVPRASARAIDINVVAVAPKAGLTELSVADVDAENPSPRTLSDARYALGVSLAPGELTTTLEVPTLVDSQIEGAESIALEITSRPIAMPFAPDMMFPSIPGLPDGTLLTGTVTDAP